MKYNYRSRWVTKYEVKGLIKHFKERATFSDCLGSEAYYKEIDYLNSLIKLNPKQSKFKRFLSLFK